jgi:flagella basal body P-ring formation protein FlgA
VVRAFVDISRAEIEKLVESALWQRIPWDHDNVQIQENKASEAARLPRGNLTYAVKFPAHTDFLGTLPVSVVFKVDQKEVRRVWTRLRIEIMGQLVVTLRPLARYQQITEEDVALETIAMTNAPANAITDLADVIGKRCRRSLPPHTALRSNMVELPPLVKRGDIVTVVAETKGLTILTRGEVRRKGHLGERIPVANLDSGRNIYAYVVDQKTVRVDF